MRFCCLLLTSLFLLVLPPPVGAASAAINKSQTPTTPLKIATASNFNKTMQKLAALFEAKTGTTVAVIPGSTGKHYAQIVHGAPFDLFFAADRERPERLEKSGRAVAGSRFTYALGTLVLWSPMDGYVDEGGAVLSRGSFGHLAVANPDLAPYGRAALEALAALGLRETLAARLVRGENIAQTFQFVDSGNAELGFVALSLLLSDNGGIRGSWWIVDPGLYGAIEQQAVLLNDEPAPRRFLKFVQSPAATAIIRAGGYRVPEKESD